MMRRARLSVRPNVRPGGRAAGVAGQASAATARDGGVAPASDPDPGKESKTAAPGESGAAEHGEPGVPQEETQQAELVETVVPVSQETPGRTSSALLQRRKRISTLPNLVKPRVSNSASAVPPSKLPLVEVPSTPPVIPTPCKHEGSSAEKGKVLSPQKSQGLLSPPQGQLITLPEKRTPVPQVPQFSPYKKSTLKHEDVSTAKSVEDPSPLKERPSQKSCSNDFSEVVKKTIARKVITSNLEKERIKRAQKLRDLLKEELRREQKAWRAKHPIIHQIPELEKSKMKMRDFVHFIPMTNPMSSSLEESRNSEKPSPVEPPVTGLAVKNNAEEEVLDDDDEEDDSQLLAPRVKVAEDGSIILDEESLTVEVIRAKAPIVEGNDPIFERGSTTTYTSFRRSNYSKPWSNQETDLFFLAISMVGTDFTMISQLFPHRQRIEIKNKFKKEEKMNGWRIDKAFRETKDFDFEFFAQLLEKALEEGKKKKASSNRPRKTNNKPRKKQKDKAAAEQSLHDEESAISEEEGADAGTAEKENKRSLDVEECSGATDPVKKKKPKRKKDGTKKPEQENNRESQDDDLTLMPKKEKSSKTKDLTLDTGNKPELHSVDDDGNLKGTLAEKKTRVQKEKPNYNETELEDENDGDFAITENSEADVSCNDGEADHSSQSPALTCEEETSLVLFTEDSDYQSGLDLSGLGEVNKAEPQASDVPVVASNFALGEMEHVNVVQEETSSSVSEKFDRSNKASDAATGQPSEQDAKSNEKPEMPQGRKARPAPNLSRASVKKVVSTDEQSDHPPDNEDISVGKGAKKVQDECLSVEEEKQMDQAEKQKMPQVRRVRPTPNLSKASLKTKVSTEEQREPPEDHGNDIDVEKDNKVLEECSSVDKQKPMDEAENTGEALSMAHNDNKVSSVKPTLPGRGRLPRPKPNLTARTSARKEKLDVPDSADVLTAGTETYAEHTDVLTSNKKEHSVKVESGEVGVSSVDEHRQNHSSSGQEDVGSESEAVPQAEKANPVQQDSDKGDSSKEKPALPVRGRLRPKPNLTKTEVRKKSSDTEKGSEHSPISERVSPVGIKSPSHTPDGDQESKVKERVESSSASQDECGKSSIKPALLARGRFQRLKPNLIKATSRKGQSEDKEVSSVQSTEHADGDTDGDLLGDGHCGKEENDMKIPESGSSQDSWKSEIHSHSPSLTQDSAVSQDPLTGETSISETQDIKSAIKPAPLPPGRLQTPNPNLAGRPEQKADIDIKESNSFEVSNCNAEKRPATDQINSFGAENVPGNESGAASLLAKNIEKSFVTGDDSLTMKKSDDGASPGTSVESTPAIIDKEKNASDEERKMLKPVVTRGRLQRPKPNLSRSAPRSAVTAPSMSAVQGNSDDSNISVDSEMLTDPENKSSAIKDTCDGAAVTALARPREDLNDPKKDKDALKPICTRFPKLSPNLGRAVRKQTSTTELSKTQDLPDTSTVGDVCKEAGQTSVEKSGSIKPAQLRRGRLIRPVPNLVKQPTKTLSPLNSKKNEDLSTAAADKDTDHAVAVSSPTKKRKAPDWNADLSPKRAYPSGATQKPKCLSDCEVDQPSLTDEPQSSSQTSSVQDLAPLQHSKFGRPLRKLSTPPLASPKSENSSDHPVRNVKPSTTKVSKPLTTKSKGKTTLVKIRATQQEDDEEEDGDLGFEDENYDLSPDMQNQAPVFIPFHLRSPKPVPAEVEETVEELEIPVDLENGMSQDLETSLFQHVVDPQGHADKKGQCDGSTEAAMTLISMGSSVYKPNIEEFLSPDQCTESDPSRNTQQCNQGPLTSPKLPSPPSSPHDDKCAVENCVTVVDPRIVEDPHCSSNPGDHPIHDSLALPVQQMSYPVMEGDADVLLGDYSSQHVGVSDCLIGEQNSGEEATFILTLVEIPIEDDYVYSCDSNVAESLPAPVMISSASAEALTETLNPSVETVSHELPTVDQEDPDPGLGLTLRKRSAQCMEGGDLPLLPKKPSVSEQVTDPKIKRAAVEGDGDGKVAHEVSDTEPVPDISPVGVTSVISGPSNWPVARTSGIVPVEVPGMSITDPLDRNLPLAYANPIMTSKTTLKRPGRKPLGFLSLVCKEKQLKKTKENRKKKNLPKTKRRKISPTVHGRQKETPDLTIENANDSEVPSSSAAEIQSTSPEQALPSVSQISDNQDTDLHSPAKSHDLATEEEAAPVSEYFFSDIFMEVDD
ncbi:LOW QUALITY PROTEIN: transcription factor TFIIIB component B'' homolog [Dendrobates tinctorius]|uniref:LOW QUALITY PROTEIN: transcription factor TFIIIB component B'' homolog n=1 Tax=Dendrobates tinctorius TaxID=92724 RepID=UPI003CCA1807